MLFGFVRRAPVLDVKFAFRDAGVFPAGELGIIGVDHAEVGSVIVVPSKIVLHFVAKYGLDGKIHRGPHALYLGKATATTGVEFAEETDEIGAGLVPELADSVVVAFHFVLAHVADVVAEISIADVVNLDETDEPEAAFDTLLLKFHVCVSDHAIGVVEDALGPAQLVLGGAGVEDENVHGAPLGNGHLDAWNLAGDVFFYENGFGRRAGRLGRWRRRGGFLGRSGKIVVVVVSLIRDGSRVVLFGIRNDFGDDGNGFRVRRIRLRRHIGGGGGHTRLVMMIFKIVGKPTGGGDEKEQEEDAPPGGCVIATDINGA